MKRCLRRALVALAAPAVAGAMFIAPSATAAVATTAAPAAALRCHASMSNSRPKDHTTTFVNVSTVKNAGVITVAHYKTGNTRHTGRANGKGNAKFGSRSRQREARLPGECERDRHLGQEPR